MPTSPPGSLSPLEGVRVIDFSRVLAGPYATRLLAEMGADVIKVEPPDGDLSRRIAPRQDRGMSGLYTLANVGKRDVGIDLRTQAGRALALQLIAAADVVVENFRPGVAERLGIGWDQVHAASPRAVMISISGFGQDSSWRDRAAYAPTIHAATGLLSYQAQVTGLPVARLADASADMVTALHATVSILAALRTVEATGQGQRIDLALYDAVLATYTETSHELLNEPQARPEAAPFDAGPLGWVALAGPPQYCWSLMVRAFPELEDPTPAGADVPTKARLRHRAMEAWMAGQADLDALLTKLDAAGLAAAPVATLGEALRGPFARERELLLEVDDRRGGRRPIVRSPSRFSLSDCRVRRPAPRLGEHNAEVLRELLSLSDERIQALEAAGILCAGEEES